MRIMLLGIGALALSACGSGATMSEDGKSATFSADDKKVTVNTEVKEAKLPADVPEYPGATTAEAMSLDDAAQTITQITLLTQDDSKKVRDFYVAAYEKNKFKYMERTSGNRIILQGKDEAPDAMITIAPDVQGRGTAIAFAIIEPKKAAAGQ